ncbi:MAG: hypothetical protein IK114_06280 [Fibrobacter sp.]|nr:hypothetical protein [Fibrobacter sp.]
MKKRLILRVGVVFLLCGFALCTKAFADVPELYFTEIHHCPAEPEPEWVEVYNASGRSLPIGEYRFCNRAKNWSVGKSRGRDSIAPYETILFSRDTLLLREYLGFKDVRLIQYAMGYLNNTAGSIAICKGDSVIDSVAWDKKTVACPSGFNPRTLRAENTPGFQSASEEGMPSYRGNSKQASKAPFSFKLSTRVVRLNKTPLRVYVEAEVPVSLKLLDSTGREQWKMEVSPYTNAWLNVPLQHLSGIGVAYISLSSGRYEKLVGLLVRP